MVSQAFVCRVTGSCFSWHLRLRSCCCWLYNTAYYTLHFHIRRRVVDFWCGRLLVLTAMWLCSFWNYVPDLHCMKAFSNFCTDTQLCLSHTQRCMHFTEPVSFGSWLHKIATQVVVYFSALLLACSAAKLFHGSLQHHHINMILAVELHVLMSQHCCF